jgi:hypothetical protein
MSINKITYLSQYSAVGFFIFTNPEFAWFYFSDYLEIKQFLNCLESRKCYVLTFELFLSELDDDDEDIPVITLCNPILVTKNSRPTLISKFLLNKIRIADEKFELNYDLLVNMRLNRGAPYIRVKYREINLF